MLEWLKKIIDKDKPESSKNFLAILSGLTLCLSFLFTVFVHPDNNNTILTVSGALVLLATFHHDQT